MTKDEALQMCLEYIETDAHERKYVRHAIKAALEAKDEPVATKNNDGVTLHLGWDDLPVGTKLYATPPQRTWIGLTMEEIESEWGLFMSGQGSGYIPDFAKALEAKLKEKNL